MKSPAITRSVATGSLTAIALACFSPAFAQAPAQKPNVLFIISDDLCCQISAYGKSQVKTPNLERLAREGVRFDRAYCNYPVCSPSRVSFLSGRYPKNTEVVGNGHDPRVVLGKDFQFMPEYFRAHGYFTAGLGKVAHTPEHQNSISWDYALDAQEYDADGTYKGDAQQMRTWPDERHPDGVSARQCVRLMEENADKPFFIAAGFHRPHAPRVAPQKYFDMYPIDSLKLAGGVTEADIPKIAYPPSYSADMSEKKQREYLQSYYASVTFMDAQVGVLLDALDRLDLRKNTIIVFIGDNGYNLGEHGGFWGKHDLMDGSARPPMIISAPGMSRAKLCGRAVEFVDIFPTLADFCAIPPQPGLDGTSLVPLLKDPDAPDWKKYARCVAVRGGRKDNKLQLGCSVHTDQYSFMKWPDGSLQLYDDKADPGQTKNLALDPKYASVIGELEPLLLPDSVPFHKSVVVRSKEAKEKNAKKQARIQKRLQE